MVNKVQETATAQRVKLVYSQFNVTRPASRIQSRYNACQQLKSKTITNIQSEGTNEDRFIA